MALRALITKDEHAKLAEALRGEYQAQSDGTYLLAVEGINGFSLENVTGLKASLSEEREAKRKLEARMTALGDIDPDKARDALSKVEKMSKWTPEEKVAEQIKAQIEQIERKYMAEIKTKDERLGKLDGAVRGLVVDSEVQRVLAGKGSAKLLLPAIRERIRVEEQDGQFRSVVLDDRGNPRITMKSGSNEQMGIEEFVLGLKSDPELGHAFFGSGHSGTGASGTSGGGGGGTGRFVLRESEARDHDRYRTMRAEAEKAGKSVEVVPD